MRYFVTVDGREHCVQLKNTGPQLYRCTIDDGSELTVTVARHGTRMHLLSTDQRTSKSVSVTHQDLTSGGARRRIQVESAALRALRNASGSAGGQSSDGLIASPMPGRIVKNLVREGDSVRAGQGVVVVEAMKMENELKATLDGTIAKVYTNAEDLVEAGAPLIEITAN